VTVTVPLWLYAKDIADDLGVSRPTACKLIKRIPGAELLYAYEGRVGERWRVSREVYAEWRRKHVQLAS
jgi:DNA-binding MarR family transcriptional regulator